MADSHFSAHSSVPQPYVQGASTGTVKHERGSAFSRIETTASLRGPGFRDGAQITDHRSPAFIYHYQYQYSIMSHIRLPSCGITGGNRQDALDCYSLTAATPVSFTDSSQPPTLHCICKVLASGYTVG